MKSIEETRENLKQAKEKAFGGRIISSVRNGTETRTCDIAVRKVLEAIRTGGTRLRDQVTEIRTRFEAELRITGDIKAAKRAVEGLKMALPGVMWCGQFSDREQPVAPKLQKYSGLLCGDMDELGQQLVRTREKLKSSPHLVALFVSPTGQGLKVVFCVPTDGAKHRGSFRAVEKHVRDLTGIQIDESGKDVGRLCFMSYDPELYHNPNATELEPLPEPEKPKAAFNSSGEANLSERQRIAGEMLGNIKWTSATSGFCVCPGNHLHTAANGERDCKIELDGAPTVHCFHNSCSGIIAGVSHELRSRIGKAEFVPADKADDDSTDLTSLSSLGLVEYPAPPGQAAYHGLAGDIVRRIEPHTEADSAALLIQTLTAFGSVIGRNAHALADASRHAGNLFAVLVGETSKARKGTAWAHVRRLFKSADAGWAQDCIVNGLSSGEGVIWAVRDPITKSSENGTEIVDAGIADKRLCVVEGEFANVLKVMTREGNTLSPVIRAAWDSGNLRSLTKNSPARATGAHVSIIGHITKGELRRLLTETESANGFANRFLPLAARRSKCLPEGGNIGSDSMNDLVARLQKAIEFARYAGEVARSDEARSLWARIYPKLSEGKPGLLGAITARAEAQVLRLSVTYALLDSSSKVEVQHLNAALALWDYCEGSAAWAFEMGTSNKNADKILSALKAAGRNGMTKWEITANVFNRNATKHEIDEALRLLHHLKLASPKLEKTGGRSAERWFYQATKHEEYEETEETDRKRGDTSYSSSPQPSQDASSAERDTKAETHVALIGEPKNEAVSDVPDVVSGHLHVVPPEADPTPKPAEEHPTGSGENLPPGRLIL